MATSCGYEFQLKHLRFESANENNFYEFQWSKKKSYFVLYRAFTLLYHWGWLIASWVFAEEDIAYTASNWSFFFTGIYYLCAFITALYGLIARNDHEVENREAPNTGRSHKTENPGGLRFFHKVTWFFQVQAIDFVIFVTVLYWALLAPDVPAETLRMPIGQHKHSVQGIMLLIDIFVVSIPTRWIQFVYSALFALFYAINTVIVHFAGINSQIYGFLDFVNSPGIVAGVLLMNVFVVPIILHTITFAFYHLKMLIYRCTLGKKQRMSDQPATFNTGHDNVAFSS
uniref:uncharacterized protein LOC120336484 n=1 Tax=Styela clava TaxID=7725 RepID=UPI001939E173|nr:uncharacterized protein LOC120336484 [Styela clava]